MKQFFSKVITLFIAYLAVDFILVLFVFKQAIDAHYIIRKGIEALIFAIVFTLVQPFILPRKK